MVYHFILSDILLIINLYFLIFVHNSYDISPNLVLAFLTIPFCIMEFLEVLELNKRLKNE